MNWLIRHFARAHHRDVADAQLGCGHWALEARWFRLRGMDHIADWCAKIANDGYRRSGSLEA